MKSPLLIPIATLFSDRDSGYLPLLKSQRYALEVATDGDSQRVMRFLFNSAVIEKFSTRILAGINREWKSHSNEALMSSQGIQETWALFDQLSQAHCADEAYRIEPDIESAAHLFHVGFKSLSTHLDKSAELPQAHAERDSLFRQLGKQEGRDVQKVDQFDANVLIHDPYCEGLLNGVTLPVEIQARLGIVCSSGQAMLTSVGNAGTATIEQFFMMRWWDAQEAKSYSLFEVLTHGHFNQMAKLAGHAVASIDEEDVLCWLSREKGFEVLLAGLYVCVQGAMRGSLQQTCTLLGKRLEIIAEEKSQRYQSFKAKYGRNPSWPFVPSTTQAIAQELQALPCMANVVKGRGLKFIRLKDQEGKFRLALPLLNTGLVRDIQQAYFANPHAPDTKGWRKLFCDINLGGAKPQNSGTFFTAFMHMGQAKSLYCDVPLQQGDLRLLKLRLAKGQTLYYISRETALSICAREVQQGTEWLGKPLSRKGQWILKARLRTWIKAVQAHNESIGEMVQQGTLSPMNFKTQHPIDYVRAEHRLILGCADANDVLIYAKHLTHQLLKNTVLTLAERRFVVRTIKSLVHDFLQAH